MVFLGKNLKRDPKVSQDKWEPLVSSGEIRKLIFHRVDKYNINLYDIVTDLGYDYEAFKRYYLHAWDLKMSPFVSPRMLIEICKKIGIEIRVTAYVDPKFDFDPKYIKVRSLVNDKNYNTDESDRTEINEDEDTG